MIAEKEVVEQALKGKMVNIVNRDSGVISYTVDGFESELHPGALGNISYNTFEDIVKRVQKGTQVEKIDCAKVITDMDYYFMFATKYDNVSGVAVGSTLPVRINEKSMIINMEVHSIALEGKNALVVLKANQALSELTQLRLAEIDVITEQVTGIKVPKKALMNINYVEKTAKIALVQSGYVYYVDAQILYMNGDYAIIENKDHEGMFTFEINDNLVFNSKAEMVQVMYQSTNKTMMCIGVIFKDHKEVLFLCDKIYQRK